MPLYFKHDTVRVEHLMFLCTSWLGEFRSASHTGDRDCTSFGVSSCLILEAFENILWTEKLHIYIYRIQIVVFFHRQYYDGF